MTYEEAVKALERVQEKLQKQEWATWEFPQTKIKTTKRAKNKNRDSADAEGRE